MFPRILLGLVFAFCSWAASAAAVVGEPAPAFSATDTAGKTVSLADFKGHWVVLEWVNPGCPFVQKHYNSGNMQDTQRMARGAGVIWLAVNSTAPEHTDYKTPAAMAQWMHAHGAAATDTLMDGDGHVGRAYGARTTPQMFLIDPAGRLLYVGAIDSKPTAHPADIASATNYVKQAMVEALEGKPVSVPVTRSYGCSVKYGGI